MDNIGKNVVAGGISLEVANHLRHKGFAAEPLTANTAYRGEGERGYLDAMDEERRALYE